MVILHYLPGLPPVRIGGMIKYALDLMVEESKQHTVFLLTAGKLSYKKKKRGMVSIVPQKKIGKISHYTIVNPLPIPMANGIRYIEDFIVPVKGNCYGEFLKRKSPDVIHVHSLMGIHYEFFRAANALGIPVVFTTHDFFGICPKTDLVKNGTICDVNRDCCNECCINAFSDIRMWLEQSSIYRLYRKNKLFVRIMNSSVLKDRFKVLRSKKKSCDFDEEKNIIQVGQEGSGFGCYKNLVDYYLDIYRKVNYFHFNSYIAKILYEKFLGNLNGKVIPVSNSDVKDCRTRRTFTGQLNIGFLGGNSYIKGLDILLDAVESLTVEEKKKIKLVIYGSNCTNNTFYCEYRGCFTSNNKAEIYKNMDVLIVPSRGIETFGMVVLEAISYAIPVIVSSNVGAADLWKGKDPGYGFVFTTKDDLVNILREIIEDRTVLAKINSFIMGERLELDYSKYVEEIIQIYKKAENYRGIKNE